MPTAADKPANKTDALVTELKTALRQKTAARKVEWKPTGNEDTLYWTSNGYSISIRRLRKGYSGPKSGFHLKFSKDGMELKSITAADPADPEYQDLQDIYDLAAESAARATQESLAEMLQDIKSA